MSDRLARAEVRSQRAIRKAQLKDLIRKDRSENPVAYRDERVTYILGGGTVSFVLAIPTVVVSTYISSALGVDPTGWIWGVGLLPAAALGALMMNSDRATYLQRHENRSLVAPQQEALAKGMDR